MNAQTYASSGMPYKRPVLGGLIANYDMIDAYAKRYVASEKENYSLRDYVNQATRDMKGMNEDPSEIKRQLRRAIRKLERLGRGGY